ncbi:hypothetical protein BDP27DRAFT_307878 [Rhodocollybia butyracea]|uniref:Uncharacterized protein n=1 Tax=Rhodocollybia butyracea TaxID=206335 RepID=A0A9P5PH42_9AGAR|nr:hypothetical protein BDP27DRAFT_307878 [Rhodocollybia butyracea]
MKVTRRRWIGFLLRAVSGVIVNTPLYHHTNQNLFTQYAFFSLGTITLILGVIYLYDADLQGARYKKMEDSITVQVSGTNLADIGCSAPAQCFFESLGAAYLPDSPVYSLSAFGERRKISFAMLRGMCLWMRIWSIRTMWGTRIKGSNESKRITQSRTLSAVDATLSLLLSR